ncbi:MAG: short-chain fatty acid transporter [Steroidobacteraceae bacterium]
MAANNSTLLTRIAQRSCAWAERWFPDAFAFAVLAVGVVAVAAMFNGAAPVQVAKTFGDGFWTLIPFTMQMCFIIIGGYVAADSPPIERLTFAMARVPTSGRGAIMLVAVFSMLLSLLHWGLSLVLASLLVRALARRTDLQMDYHAAGAAAYLGVGSVWAMGLSSSAAQLQANPASMPVNMLAITGVIPFEQTIFLWQSIVLTLILTIVSAMIAWYSTPLDAQARTATQLGIPMDIVEHKLPLRTRPGEWLEYSPLLNLGIVALGVTWLFLEFRDKGMISAISSFNTYNFLFLMVGLLLQWRPRNFLDAVARSVPSVAGVLIQFPFYGGVAAILINAANGNGVSLANGMSHFFSSISTHETFALITGSYSAVLGLFFPSAGGKWIIEAPYVMQTANDLKYHLGWTVQIYNASEALPNLINPIWMLPVLGILKLKARDLIGYTFVQFIVHVPLVLLLLWILGRTLTYISPVMPG